MSCSAKMRCRANTQSSILIVHVDNQRDREKKIARIFNFPEFLSVLVKLLTKDSQKILQILINCAFRWHTQRITSKIQTYKEEMRTPESPKTLYDKIFDEHVVRMEEDGTATLYIDRHLVHEVTSAQAFEGLRMNGRSLWRKSSIVATADHNTPTTGWEAGMEGITDPISKLQVTTLEDNIRQNGCAAFFPFLSRGQGVIHVMGPEEGATLPAMTVVCGDSHTSTHGACAAIAFGIGTSEVEHVMATQTLLTKKMKNMRVHVDGRLQPGVFAKDLALYVIGKIGTAGGTGCAIEFDGPAIRALSMEGRMTLCNMAIEAGARCGLVACDDKTIEYMKGRSLAPEGELLDQAIEYWKTLHSD